MRQRRTGQRSARAPGNKNLSYYLGGKYKALSDRKFEFSDTAHFRGTHMVTLTNTGDKLITYNFSLEAARPQPHGESMTFGQTASSGMLT